MRVPSLLLAAIALAPGVGVAAAGPPLADAAKPQAVAPHTAAPKLAEPRRPRLLEPSLRLGQSAGHGTRVALTLDACDGRTDDRILGALVDNRIPATIFITGKWLKHNAVALATMHAHPELFELEDHGARHIPAVDAPISVYGIKAAGSSEAVTAEVEGGATALEAAGETRPRWFRGATAKYSLSSIALIRRLGFKIGGYSLNADGGSLLGAAATEKRLASARDGDVIIAHINQPTHPAGEGLVKGLLALKAKGVTFVRLDDAVETNEASE